MNQELSGEPLIKILDEVSSVITTPISGVWYCDAMTQVITCETSILFSKFSYFVNYRGKLRLREGKSLSKVTQGMRSQTGNRPHFPLTAGL